jgi:hypothetical protein
MVFRLFSLLSKKERWRGGGIRAMIVRHKGTVAKLKSGDREEAEGRDDVR